MQACGVPRGTKGGQLYFLSPCTDASVKVAEMRTRRGGKEADGPTDRRATSFPPSVHTLAARNEVWARARTQAGRWADRGRRRAASGHFSDAENASGQQ